MKTRRLVGDCIMMWRAVVKVRNEQQIQFIVLEECFLLLNLKAEHATNNPYFGNTGQYLADAGFHLSKLTFHCYRFCMVGTEVE